MYVHDVLMSVYVLHASVVGVQLYCTDGVYFVGVCYRRKGGFGRFKKCVGNVSSLLLVHWKEDCCKYRSTGITGEQM